MGLFAFWFEFTSFQSLFFFTTSEIHFLTSEERLIFLSLSLPSNFRNRSSRSAACRNLRFSKLSFASPWWVLLEPTSSTKLDWFPLGFHIRQDTWNSLIQNKLTDNPISSGIEKIWKLCWLMPTVHRSSSMLGKKLVFYVFYWRYFDVIS